jgi:hypothetical protein
LNKKQEALRRGLRSFIEDASRELADLEGRELSRRPAERIDRGTMPPDQAAAESPPASRRTSIQDAPEVAPEAPPRPRAAGADPQDEQLMSPARTAPPAEQATPAKGVATVREPEKPGVPVPAIERSAPVRSDTTVGEPEKPTVPPPAVEEPAPVRNEATVGEPEKLGVQRPAAEGAAPPRHEASVGKAEKPAVEPPAVETPAPARAADPAPVETEPAAHPAARRSRKRQFTPARPGAGRKRTRHRPAPAPGLDGLSFQQARSRKGVCSAYFINEQCWQVAEAYCNTALQVCITRECPVYHLHKEALEQRFARKFKHLW